jgi:hypothetical protein
LRFSAFVFVLVTILLLIKNYKKGLRAWVANVKQRFWVIVGEDATIVAVVLILILFYNVLREPYLAWDGEHNGQVQARSELDRKASDLHDCGANLKTEEVKSQLLGNQVAAQQTQISGQQSTSATQQSTFDLCVTTLAKADAPIAQSTTILIRADDPPASPEGKHTALLLILTNKPVTPAKLLLWCGGTIKTATASLFDNEPFSGAATPLKSGSPFLAPAIWQINMASPVWAPEAPILIKISYDEDDIGHCAVKM